jgi:hypothetical protein
MHRVALRAALHFSLLLLACSVAAKRAYARAQLSPEMQHKTDDIAAVARVGQAELEALTPIIESNPSKTNRRIMVAKLSRVRREYRLPASRQR